MTGSSSRFLLLAAVLLLPRPALAEPPVAPPTLEQVEAARAVYKDARELHRQGRLHEAAEKAQQAHAMAATPVTALELGQILVELGRLVDARDVLRSVALMPVSPRESEKGRDARVQTASLARQLDMRIPKLAFADRPASVEVLLDGKPVATVDATAWLGVDPGTHALLVRVEDRVCTTVTLSLSEGEERTVDLHDAAAACRPEPPPTAPPARTVTPYVPPPPVSPVPAPPPDVTRGGDTAKIVSVVLVGAGAVSVGVGGYLALSAKSSYDSVASECGPRGCTQNGFDVRNSARSQADVATVVLGVGAAAILGGVVVWLVDPSPRVRVGVGPGGVALGGTLP